jgi:hypothetical protein
MLPYVYSSCLNAINFVIYMHELILIEFNDLKKYYKMIEERARGNADAN